MENLSLEPLASAFSWGCLHRCDRLPWRETSLLPTEDLHLGLSITLNSGVCSVENRQAVRAVWDGGKCYVEFLP